jgi:hypothetical protein
MPPAPAPNAPLPGMPSAAPAASNLPPSPWGAPPGRTPGLPPIAPTPAAPPPPPRPTDNVGGATGVLQAMSPSPNSGPLPFAFSEPPAPAPAPPIAPPPAVAGAPGGGFADRAAAAATAGLRRTGCRQASSLGPAALERAPAVSAAGPSEYTQMIQKAAPPPPAPAAKPAADERSNKASDKRLPLGLIVALNVIVILAVALVLYFVLRPRHPANRGPRARGRRTRRHRATGTVGLTRQTAVIVRTRTMAAVRGYAQSP